MEASRLDTWLLQKQPGLGPLIFWKKLYRFALSTTPAKRPKGIDAKTRSHWSATIARGQRQKDQFGNQIKLQIRRYWVTRQEPELEDKQMRNSHGNFDSF